MDRCENRTVLHLKTKTKQQQQQAMCQSFFVSQQIELTGNFTKSVGI